MARQIDTKNTVLLTPEERDKLVDGMDAQDMQYLRERPWQIEEYERQGYTKQMEAVRSGGNTPEVDPSEASRVTTEKMRLGALEANRTPQPNGVVPDDEDEDDEDYESWTVADLKAEIDDRNSDRDPATALATSGNKQELIDRLRADDEAQENT